MTLKPPYSTIEMLLKQLIVAAFIQFLLIGPALAEAVKVAFIGDQGTNANAQSVLQLIASEQTDLLLIQGDLGYEGDQAAIWESNLTTILGVDFPVLTVVGNHENFEWPSYKTFISNRIARIPDLTCEGDIGVKALCTFKGIEVLQVAPGIVEVPGVNGFDNYEAYIDQNLAASGAQWRICSWHKNQHKMQVGAKLDETDWGVYQACLRGGGIVATGHEHSYSRTFLMSDFQTQAIVHKDSYMEIKKGNSFAFVSGLGGRGIRAQHRSDEWWASIQSLTQAATYGALFCAFDSPQTSCYYKDISGNTHDSFMLTSNLHVPPPSGMAYIISIIMALLVD